MAQIYENGTSFDLPSAQVLDPRFFSLSFFPYPFYLEQPPLVPFMAIDGSLSNGDQDYFRVQGGNGDQLQAMVLRGTEPALRIGLYFYDTGGFITASAPNTNAVAPAITYDIGNNTDYTLGLQENTGRSVGYTLLVSFVTPGILLEGGAGADERWGGMGRDTLRGFDPADPLAETGADTLRGFAFNDLLQGGGGNDLLEGGSDRDTLSGGDGADTLYGDHLPAGIGAANQELADQSSGEDRLSGGNGDDLVIGGWGSDVLQGGAGADTLIHDDGSGRIDRTYSFSRPDFFGFGGGDTFYGPERRDTLIGGTGNDSLVGGNGDQLAGGEGADTLKALSGIVDGGEGSDLLVTLALGSIEVFADGSGLVSSAAGIRLTFTGIEHFALRGSGVGDRMLLGAGHDSVDGGGGPDTVMAGLGNDTLTDGDGGGGRLAGDGGNDLITLVGPASWGEGAAGNDTLTTTGSGNVLSGGLGSDLLRDTGGAIGGNRLSGDAGADTVLAGGQDAVIETGSGQDLIQLGFMEGEAYRAASNAVVDAGSANDRIVVLGGSHLIFGGDNFDVLEMDFSRTLGDVRIRDLGAGLGEASSLLDRLVWEEIEAIFVTGSASSDRFVGGASHDTMNGAGGADTLIGGAGFDEFRLDRATAQGDVLADFTGRGALAGDRIVLSGFGAGATLTALGGDQWQASGAAGSATFTIIGAVHASDYSFV